MPSRLLREPLQGAGLLDYQGLGLLVLMQRIEETRASNEEVVGKERQVGPC